MTRKMWHVGYKTGGEWEQAYFSEPDAAKQFAENSEFPTEYRGWFEKEL